MLKEKKLNLFGQFLLIVATLFWGTSFIILKDTIDVLPVMMVLSVRFFCSALVLFLIFFKRIIKMSKHNLITGLILGVILASAYLFQTYGLTTISPGENAFLTATYSVMVPFMCWLFYKKRPDVYSVVAGVLCATGIGFISLFGKGNIGFGIGQILTLISAVLYGLQIIVLGSRGKEDDAISSLFLQLLIGGVVCIIGSLSFEQGWSEITFSTEIVLKLIYMTIFTTLVAQGCQLFGQRYVLESQASILLSMESVFGLLFSLMLGGEDLTVFSVVGFVLIFVSVIISETKLDFLKRKKDVNKQ